MNLQLNQELLKDNILDHLEGIGVPKSTVRAILLCGSALYLDEPNDIDVKVMVRSLNPKAEVLRDFEFDGLKVQTNIYTFKDWALVKNYKNAYFIQEAQDMVLIYGDDTRFERFDVLEQENKEYLIDIYDRFLFNYNENDKKAYQMPKKRLWNFLLFAFKVENNSNVLTPEQKTLIKQAHNLDFELEDFRDLFNNLKNEINNA